ncbi:ABC-ATPase domain-containing protein [Vibrio chagasii]|nr:ABC-ATPase domain-containing protein [Vibrio chagasii]
MRLSAFLSTAIFPGDGREGIVTAIDTMKIRAEDGRYCAQLKSVKLHQIIFQ